MIVVLSGEGPTDLGQCVNAQLTCEDEHFGIGPMTVLLDQMLESRLGYSQRMIPGGYKYVSEAALGKREIERKNNHRKISLVGKKRAQETAYFYINAWMLSDIALQVEKESEDRAIAVLFRDCDGTRSAQSDLWTVKWESMLAGFLRPGFDRGVPMLPKPTSEAWLLCAAQNQPYQNCSNLENLSGNMVSPNHPKKKLDAAFGHRKTAQDLCDWLDQNRMDFDALPAVMPSFKAFRDRLYAVV
jgi:hypothetical protein